METRFHWFVRLSPVILAYKSIELCKCSGNVLIGYAPLKCIGVSELIFEMHNVYSQIHPALQQIPAHSTLELCL